MSLNPHDGAKPSSQNDSQGWLDLINSPRALNENFNLKTLEGELARNTAQKRIVLAHNWFRERSNKNIVLTSSFGVQSILMLEFVKASGFDIPVLSVDIAGEKYDQQRQYREHLQRAMGFDLHIVHAKDDADKVPAMDRALRQFDAGVVLSGIRASQTENRAGKTMVEWNVRNGTMEIRPLLDWPNRKADYYVSKVSKEFRHPNFDFDVTSTGGVVNAMGEEKTECGLHVAETFDHGAGI